MSDVFHIFAFGFGIFLLLRKVSEMKRFLNLRIVLLTVFISCAMLYFFGYVYDKYNQEEVEYVCEPTQFCITEYAGPF